MKIQDYRSLQAKAMSERQLQDQIIELAKRMGLIVYHTHDSRRSEPGFPDIVLVHPKQRRVMWRELKSETGTTTPEQKVWISTLSLVGEDVDVWRPRDWVSGRIERELRGQ
ncbi:VRR-NUC domain-containing protein [Brevibacterium phage 4C]|uniref:VRR-NUC domain-containing protein n=28 Tax=Agmunavirus AGM1 TaxID=2843882 RepID=A0A7D0GJT4_9CAUD|nr:VRR-NUC domain-containing protein [Brevibacterium phage AGM1]QDH85694.1 VRR-NUC domain-containing protein [Brevibacterium phage AGM2]QDH85800.1 VRR-NUC domain-containing protein [Brevibacterium phage AGM4]QDH85853.1 VRR-NUC domain-containing protein [Brevibacterium phage AGM5]QDH85906.1 VRR-NUC domain-containing protein [Brevibacterium phage AGM6]QDH86065.1 VRR-NUC domain-containing protein [Brevibacterium phage AGM9]QDH86118.1 VRR-NUC domain-containing protein [Brevibacterium phage AGM10]